MIASYDHHSPSSLNLFAAAPAMWVLEKVLGEKQTVGVTAHRGVAVEHGVAHGLKHLKASETACCTEAFARYDLLTALSGDRRRAQYRADIPDMVTQALDELRPYGEPSDMQGRVEQKFPGLKLPMLGYYDFIWSHKGVVVDLKTTEKMPSQIKIAHARQVSFYTGDNVEGRLTYCTPKKCQTYRLENIRSHRTALINIARTVERLLDMSDDPQFFIEHTVPDLESFYWKEPAVRALAYKYWRI